MHGILLYGFCGTSISVEFFALLKKDRMAIWLFSSTVDKILFLQMKLWKFPNPLTEGTALQFDAL